MEKVETYEKRANDPSTKYTVPSIDEEVVGFEEDAKVITQKLTRGTKGLDVISIFGMAGLGKTTLARKVYTNPSIVDHFDVHVWCAVSQTYNVKNLLAEILKQTSRGTGEINEDEDDIADKLRKSLLGKRYLIVLDDIWEAEAWEYLRLSFPNGENGSRVMVTTRVEEVANQLKYSSDPYCLKFLTLEESWELFMKRVFQGKYLCLADLLEAGLQVAKYCKGLPLVIVLIAGIISKMERHASLWLEVANDLSSHILGEQSMKAIQSSYDHLEGHLKPPLLYVALFFPEDYSIPVSKLLKWWMAEEIVHNMQEETAKVCLNELVSRSLVMVSKRSNKNGDIKYCMLHDLVREFCFKKLARENFRHHILPYYPSTSSNHSEELGRAIRFIHSDLIVPCDKADWMNILIKEKESHDQLFDLSLEFVLPPATYHPPHIVGLRLIRVLILDEMESSSALVEALKLTKHLRYLKIKVGNHFDFEWVSHLCHLQVLRVLPHSDIRSSVAPFWKMTKLSHVYITNFSFIWEEKDIINFSHSCGTPVLLKNLKIFSTYNISMVDMKLHFWNRFPNLEQFNIQIEGDEFGNIDSLFPRLMDNVRLQSLKVSNYSTTVFLRDHGRSNRFPYFVPFSLKDVRLENIVMPTENILSIIASLHNLEHLTLYSLYMFQRTCWDMGDNKFHALKCLKLCFAYRLHEWHCSEETFPVLERLVLNYCPKLEEIPACFADIPTLKLIKLIGCENSLKQSALNIKNQVKDITGCDSLQVLISGFKF